MHTKIFVNLPVKDLARAKEFWSSLGYSFDAKFAGEKSACIILGESILVMLLVEDLFAGFAHKPVCDAHERVEVLHALTCDNREHVDTLIAKARAAGATIPDEADDDGFMYAQGFYDLDGHGWNCCAWSTEAECK
ncbi:VOC family protein [Undibacterium sp.]|uniref:VOC family protein n=1 Tax=Undibacterium sp. TaxID=1914977 RepID=UPI0027318ED0|nr:VOC family protein [Undibacterium sp.]MDP1979558.1 glyoxalase/bleomycin resistance/extradiol dioxygenase family protein [Undibacterium sp.]